MMFVALLVTLCPSSAQRADAQACLSFSQEERDLFEWMYASFERRWSIAHLRGREREEMLRVTLWGEHASEEAMTLVAHLAGHPLLIIGSSHYTVQSVSLSQQPWASQATWTDLTRSSNDRLIGFRFVSPMTLHHPVTSEGSAFPEPLAVFSQLRMRWMDLGGPPLTSHLLSCLEQNGYMVSDYQLHLRHQVLPYHWQTGWVGWILYECRDRHPECLTDINSLARLACFTGTGWETEHGMGLTRLMHPSERRD